MFSFLKNNFLKSKAAVIVQNLLEIRRDEGCLTRDPAKLANSLVESAWSSRPRVFSGGFGDKPLEISIVISALKEGLGSCDLSQVEKREIAIALAMAIEEAHTNEEIYSFKKVDIFLINEAMEELDLRMRSLGLGS